MNVVKHNHFSLIEIVACCVLRVAYCVLRVVCALFRFLFYRLEYKEKSLKKYSLLSKRI